MSPFGYALVRSSVSIVGTPRRLLGERAVSLKTSVRFPPLSASRPALSILFRPPSPLFCLLFLFFGGAFPAHFTNGFLGGFLRKVVCRMRSAYAVPHCLSVALFPCPIFCTFFTFFRHAPFQLVGIEDVYGGYSSFSTSVCCDLLPVGGRMRTNFYSSDFFSLSNVFRGLFPCGISLDARREILSLLKKWLFPSSPFFFPDHGYGRCRARDLFFLSLRTFDPLTPKRPAICLRIAYNRFSRGVRLF